MFKVSPVSLQTFFDTPNCVLEDRVQYSTVRIPNVFCDGHFKWLKMFNPLNAELNPICHFLALLGAQTILHVSRIRVKIGLHVFCTVIIRCTETFWSPCIFRYKLKDIDELSNNHNFTPTLNLCYPLFTLPTCNNVAFCVIFALCVFQFRKNSFVYLMFCWPCIVIYVPVQ
jgi:hypothetical protein